MILAFLAAIFVVGVVVGSALPGGTIVLVVVACLCLVVSWLLRHRWAWRIPLGVCVLCFGAARSPHLAPATAHDLRFYNGASVQLQGTVDAEPDVRDTGANYDLSVSTIVIGTRSVRVSGRVAVHTTSASSLEYGDQVTARGQLVTPVNDAAVPWADILARQGIYCQMSYPALIDTGPSHQSLMGMIVALRQRLEAGINRWLPEPEAALLIAITLGAHSASLGDLTKPLIDTGLIHLIAISGIKVALVAGIMYQVGRLFARRSLSLILPLVVLWTYVSLTGDTASGIRSAAMWSMVFIALSLGRGTVALLSLSVVAAGMVALNPALPWDTGFQLSAVGTFAIVAFTEPLTRLIRPIPSPWRETLAVTVAAQVGTLPIVILGFHQLSLTGPLANAVVLPLLPILIALGFVVGALAAFPLVAAPLSAVAYALTHLVVVTSRWLAGLGGYAALNTLPAMWTIVYYLGLALMAGFVLKRAYWRPLGLVHRLRREMMFGSALGAVALGYFWMQGVGTTSQVVEWLGSGNAMLVRGGSQTVLIDGSKHPFTLLERLGSEMPWDQHAIDAIIITDPRATNTSGDVAVLAHYRVRTVYDVGIEYPSGTYARWRALLRSDHVAFHFWSTRESLVAGGIHIRSIGPDAIYPNPKDSMGLLRVTVDGRSILLVGAASPREQLEAVFRPVKLRSGTLIANGPLDPTFARAVSAGVTYDAVPAPGSRLLRANSIERIYP